MSTIGELASQFEVLLRAKKAAASNEAACNKEIESLQQQLLDLMSDEGLPSVKLESGMTLFRRTETYYGVGEGFDKKKLVEALANCELTRDLVEAKYDSNALRARMKELELTGDSLPAELLEMLKVTKKEKVGHRS